MKKELVLVQDLKIEITCKQLFIEIYSKYRNKPLIHLKHKNQHLPDFVGLDDDDKVLDGEDG